LALPPRDAMAQKAAGFALNQFEPAPAGGAFFGVPQPAVGGHLVPRALLEFDFALRPFHLPLPRPTQQTHIRPGQGFLRADASLALWDRLLVSADMPVAIVNTGEDPRVPGVDFHPPKGAAVGDLRIGARGRIFGNYRDPFQLGLGGSLYLPT